MEYQQVLLGYGVIDVEVQFFSIISVLRAVGKFVQT